MASSAVEATLTVSDVQPGSKDVIYSWSVSVALPVAADSIEVSLPPGTGGEPGLYLVDGLPGGKLKVDGDVIGYSFESVRLSAGHKIIFAVGGLTNPDGAGPFSSAVTMGGVTATTPAISLDHDGGTRAMAFVTAEAAKLSSQDASPGHSSRPVLMTNEQAPAFSSDTGMTSPWSAATSASVLAAVVAASMVILIARRTFEVA